MMNLEYNEYRQPRFGLAALQGSKPPLPSGRGGLAFRTALYALLPLQTTRTGLGCRTGTAPFLCAEKEMATGLVRGSTNTPGSQLEAEATARLRHCSYDTSM